MGFLEVPLIVSVGTGGALRSFPILPNDETDCAFQVSAFAPRQFVHYPDVNNGALVVHLTQFHLGVRLVGRMNHQVIDGCAGLGLNFETKFLHDMTI